MAKVMKKSFGRKGGVTTMKRRGKKVSKFRKGKMSGYKVTKYPKRGKNKKIIVKKIKIKR